MTLPKCIQLWRDDAATLRRRGDRRAARLLERVASELEDELRQDGPAELVDLTRAIELSGYTRGHLRRLLVAGTLINHGTPHRPLFRPADLPRKARRPPPAPRDRSTGRDLALSVVGRRRG